jgi:hypothetical protein
MPFYTFHAFRADGAPLGLESGDYPSAFLAHEHAEAMLEAHLSAHRVAVWRDDVEISSVERN